MTKNEMIEIALQVGFKEDFSGIYHPSHPEIQDIQLLLFDFGKRITETNLNVIIRATFLEGITVADIRRIALENKVKL